MNKQPTAGDIIGHLIGTVIVLCFIAILLFGAHGIGTHNGKAQAHEEAVKLGLGEWVIQEPRDQRQSRTIQFRWIVTKLPETISPSTTETLNAEK